MPYSYHTFLFPFLWNDGGKTSLERFEKVIDAGSRWVLIAWEDRKKNDDGGKWRQDYAAYQYFTEEANAAIFNTSDLNIVRCYEYRDGGNFVSSLWKYCIFKDKEEFLLDINNIRMHVFNTGVAILVLEIENNAYKTIDDVNKINEYGRRINMPYLPTTDTHSLCADRIQIWNNIMTEKEEDYVFETQDYQKVLTALNGEAFKEESQRIIFDYVMKPIQKLIDGNGKDNGGIKVTSNKQKASEKYIFIKPCIDDRMFVCCLVADDQLSQEIKADSNFDYCFLEGWDQRLTRVPEKGVMDNKGNKKDDYLEGWADETYLSNRIYKLLFIENDLTCQNTHMKRELLLKSVYPRWLNTGTLYGSTHHSLVCLTNSFVEQPVINPFLTQYVQIAILTLAQRSTILALAADATTVSNEIYKKDETGKDNESTTLRDIKKIEKLQEKYVRALNQLFLTEVSVQEQGVELYQLIKESLYIDANKAELDGHMNNLRDIANIINDRLERRADDKLNQNLSWLTLIGLGIAILQLIPVFDQSVSLLGKAVGITAVVVVVLGIILLRSTLFNTAKK